MYLIRTIRVTCGMSEMEFRDTPQNREQARSYFLTLKKRGKRPQLDKIVQIVMGRNEKDGSLKLSPKLTESEFKKRLQKIRQKSA